MKYIDQRHDGLEAWIKAARQQVSDISPSNYHLPGGDEQLFINYIERQDPNFQTILKSTKTKW